MLNVEEKQKLYLNFIGKQYFYFLLNVEEKQKLYLNREIENKVFNKL